MAHYKYDRSKREGKAMYLWEQLAEDYRIKVIKYRFLVSTKKEKGILPLKKMLESDVQNYPSIPFFRILSEDEAKFFLKNLPDQELEHLITYILNVIQFDFTYRTMSSRICDYEWEIEHQHYKKPTYMAIDPDRCLFRNGTKRSSHGGGNA